MAIASAGGKPLDGDPHTFRDRLKARYADGDYQKGFVQGSRSPATVAPSTRPAAAATPAARPCPCSADASYGAGVAELWVYPSILLYDGRLANRAWMQEIGDPISFATWGSWIDMHPKKALSLGLRQDTVIRVEQDGRAVEVPVRLTEEIDQSTVGLQLGQGHTQLGRFANGFGVNGWAILPGRPEGLFGTVKLQRTDRIDSPAYISPTEEQHHREILQWLPLAQASTLKAGRAVMS